MSIGEKTMLAIPCQFAKNGNIMTIRELESCQFNREIPSSDTEKED